VTGDGGMTRDMAVKRRYERAEGEDGCSGLGAARLEHTAQVIDNTWRPVRGGGILVTMEV
jgi:hypothetical protein